MLIDEQLVLKEAQEDLATAKLKDLDQIKSKYIGKNGRIGSLLRNISNLPRVERKDAGRKLNKLRLEFNILLQARLVAIEAENLQENLTSKKIDVTLPGRKVSNGSRHPVTLITERACQIFTSMGFSIADGPEIEDDFHNFEALNHPEDHPARSMHDTFYFPDGKLLRTHTSPVQIRYMQSHQPPFRVIAPGRVYRVDNDATHSPMFHQIEGLWVDDQVRFSDLKGILLSFYRELFEDPKIDIRFRPSYFPFTEPSAEVDIKFKDGKWMEVAGCGMVHPNVLANVEIDSSVWQGFAFGTGIDRMAMLRYGITDLRDLFDNDVRFLRQFV